MPPSDLVSPLTPQRRSVIMLPSPMKALEDKRSVSFGPSQPLRQAKKYEPSRLPCILGGNSTSCHGSRSSKFRRQSSAPVVPLQRNSSCGSASSNGSSSRRSLFGSFWEREQSGSSLDRKLPQSVIIESSLPSPMLRLRKHAGVYPLMQPKSILRFSKTDPSRFSDHNKTGNCCATPNSPSAELHDTHTDSTADDSTSSSSCAAAIYGASRTVQFDPRITVTEFPNSPRVWYTDAELEGFKNATVLLAKQYLSRHPQEILLYSKATLDPVTQTYRKKALFCMPALSSLDDDMDQPESKVIRTILVVDQSPRLLALFRRSLQSMFHAADISTTTCVEQASRLVEKKDFDMVIAEGATPRLFALCRGRSTLCVGVQSSFQSCVNENEDETSSSSSNQHDLADLVWSKPPPRMDSELRRSLEDALEAKRQ